MAKPDDIRQDGGQDNPQDVAAPVTPVASPAPPSADTGGTPGVFDPAQFVPIDVFRSMQSKKDKEIAELQKTVEGLKGEFTQELERAKELFPQQIKEIARKVELDAAKVQFCQRYGIAWEVLEDCRTVTEVQQQVIEVLSAAAGAQGIKKPVAAPGGVGTAPQGAAEPVAPVTKEPPRVSAAPGGGGEPTLTTLEQMENWLKNNEALQGTDQYKKVFLDVQELKESLSRKKKSQATII